MDELEILNRVMSRSRLLGRKKIYTNQKKITKENIIDVLRKAYGIHQKNAREIEYLFNYEKGVQPLVRDKKVRKDIDIKISDNAANYVTEFKLGYFWANPPMLIQHGNKELHKSDADIDDLGITSLNEMLKNGEGIGKKDLKLGDYVEKCGIGHRMVDIKTDFKEDSILWSSNGEFVGSLVNIYTLDSKYAFCVYYNGPGQKKLMGVTFVKYGGKLYFTCFTDSERFEISGWKIEEQNVNPLQKIPIVEYERSVDRMGCFERHISDMDGLNVLVSDFANDSSQRTQELWWGDNVDFKDENGEEVRPQSGDWVLTYSGEGKTAKIQPLSSSLDGNATLQGISYRWNRILQKCKVPTQSDSTGGGSTGVAEDIASGWAAAEVDAQKEQTMIEDSRREELNLILKAISFVPEKILDADNPIRKLHGMDIDIHYDRKQNTDLTVKSNFIATLIKCGFEARHVIKQANLFNDPEQVYLDSKEGILAFQKSQISNGDESEMENTSEDPINQISNSPNVDGTDIGKEQVM